MAEIVLGCDRNGHNDAEYQNTVASILEKAGHTVEKTAIEPNAFASYSDGSNGKNPKGKIGIYLIAAGTYSIADATYGTSQFKYNYFGIRPECSPNWDVGDFDTKPIGADSDCPGWLCSKIAGNSFSKINEIVKEKSRVVTGKDATEMGNNLVDALGGSSSSDGDSNDSNSDGGSSGNVKECIQNLLKHWDGDVECVIKGKNVYINKVRDPEACYAGLLYEGVNVISDNVTVTDVNPNTPNYLIVEWSDGIIELRDEKLIARFGEKPWRITAVRKNVVTYVDDSSSNDESSSDSSSSSDSGSEESSGDSQTSNTEDTSTDTVDGWDFYTGE